MRLMVPSYSPVFCDNCSCYCSDDRLQELANHGNLLITYSPHTSHIFQVLDVMLFRRRKSAKKYLPCNQELDPHVDQTIRVFRACEIAITSTTSRGSWNKAGFGFVRRNDIYYCGPMKARSGEAQNFRRFGDFITQRQICINERKSKSRAG
jgi:hypothetical protein